MSILRTAIRSVYLGSQTTTSKGNYGEMVVASIFHPRFFGIEEHYIINNIYFRTSDNKTHQIDHVVIYKNGIFCIETKNIKGSIIGSNDSKMWASHSIKFLNPMIQNNTHVRLLEEFYNNKYRIHSIVVFVNENKPKDVSKEVVNLSELKDYVKNYETDTILSSEQMKDIYNKLLDQKDNSGVTKKEHISNHY